jgi:mannose-6-phosphate isomerase-like protein (cupin superfamily)
MKTALMAGAASPLASSAAGQTAQPPSMVVSEHELHEQIALLVDEAQAKGSSGATLVDYGRYRIQLSVRTRSGGAEVHAHWDDVMMVKQGHATLVTGGTVIESRTGADGETTGTRIEGGASRELGPGDVFTIRAGTPHQTVVADGTLYAAVVIKIHEP